jgi:Right handed beta helix region
MGWKGGSIDLGRLAGVVLVVLVVLAGLAAPAGATPPRRFVAGSGQDVGACNRDAPCRTFGYALTQSDPGGEIVAVDSAGYGPVTIDKPISLIGAPGVHAAITPPSGTAITVAAGTTDQVVLRHLYLNGFRGAADGVDYQSAGAVVVEDCVIANFAEDGIVRFVDSSDAAQLTVSDSVLRGNNIGLFLRELGSGSIVAQIDHTRAALNGSVGFAIRGDARATITDSIAARNTVGFFLDSSGVGPARLFMERDTASGNGTGIVSVGAAARAVVSNSTIVDNTTGLLSQGGGQLVSRVNNTLTDNTTNGAFTSTILPAYRIRNF